MKVQNKVQRVDATLSSPPQTQELRPPIKPAVKEYGITIYCTLAQISVRSEFTQEDLESYLKDIKVNGFADTTRPGSTTIYPAHTITKITVQEL